MSRLLLLVLLVSAILVASNKKTKQATTPFFQSPETLCVPDGPGAAFLSRGDSLRLPSLIQALDCGIDPSEAKALLDDLRVGNRAAAEGLMDGVDAR